LRALAFRSKIRTACARPIQSRSERYVVTSLSPQDDTALDPLDQEMALFLEVVRLSRVTLAYAQPDAATREFIRSTLVPLLRCADSRRPRTVPVLFDAWGDDPLTALHARIEEAVRGSSVDLLRTWEARLDVTFIIIFDEFDRYLAASANGEGITPFDGELIEAVTDPKLRSNFLLVVNDEAPLLDRFLGRIPGLGGASVRLPRPALSPGGPGASEGDYAVEATRVPQVAPADASGDRTEEASHGCPAAHDPARVSDFIPAYASRATGSTGTHSRMRDAVHGPTRTTRSGIRRVQAGLAAVACLLIAGLYFVITMSPRTDRAASLTALSASQGVQVQAVQQAQVSEAPELPPAEPEATIAPAEPPPLEQTTSGERLAKQSLPDATNAAASPVRENASPPLPRVRPADEAQVRAKPATAPRPPVAAAARPAPHMARSIDVVYRQRASEECSSGPIGFLCREAIRRELCNDGWSVTQTRGRTVCHVREVAAPLSD
jgi:hypothetical protein